MVIQTWIFSGQGTSEHLEVFKFQEREKEL